MRAIVVAITLGVTQVSAPATEAPTVRIPSLLDPAWKPDRPAGDLGSIRFVTSGDFPPFNHLDGRGQLAGYNVDLARAICDELAATCTIQMRPFSDLVPALDERRADAIIAGLAPSPAIRRKLDFTEAYLGFPARFVARQDLAIDPSPAAVAGRSVAVVAGSAHEAYLQRYFPAAKATPFPTAVAAREALRDGAADLAFGDGLGLAFWLGGETSRGCCAFRGGPYLDPTFFGEGLRIAVPRANTRLRRALDYAIARLNEKGRLAELYLRWFPIGYY